MVFIWFYVSLFLIEHVGRFNEIQKRHGRIEIKNRKKNRIWWRIITLVTWQKKRTRTIRTLAKTSTNLATPCPFETAIPIDDHNNSTPFKIEISRDTTNLRTTIESRSNTTKRNTITPPCTTFWTEKMWKETKPSSYVIRV